jgi:hypothetical protein
MDRGQYVDLSDSTWIVSNCNDYYQANLIELTVENTFLFEVIIVIKEK